MPPQYRPRHHQIKALPRPIGSSSKGHITRPYFVTLHLLETIKEACRDRSKGTEKDRKRGNPRKRITAIIAS
jgi:hypothetical protein